MDRWNNGCNLTKSEQSVKLVKNYVYGRKKVSVEHYVKNNGDGYVWMWEQCKKQQ